MTVSYDRTLLGYGRLMKVADFKIDCALGTLTDDTGFAEPVRDLAHPLEALTNPRHKPDLRVADHRINPSSYRTDLPDDATHVVWYSSVRHDRDYFRDETSRVKVGRVQRRGKSTA